MKRRLAAAWVAALALAALPMLGQAPEETPPPEPKDEEVAPPPEAEGEAPTGGDAPSAEIPVYLPPAHGLEAPQSNVYGGETPSWGPGERRYQARAGPRRSRSCLWRRGEAMSSQE